jgi:hypothetical protein
MSLATYKGANEPRRVLRDLKPASHLYLSDRYAPGHAEHWYHVEAIARANGGRGFPFYPSDAWGRP